MNKNLKRLLVIVYVLVLIVMLAGATFAYFAVIKVSNVTPTIEAGTAQTDWLIFKAGEPINIYADERVFGIDDGNLWQSTQASATLEVSNPKNEALYYYDLFLEIEENDFIYTTEEQTAELILTISGPDGEIKNIDGLEYVTVGDVSGFDITNKNGRYYIAEDYELHSNSKIVQNWDVTVTFINLETNQNANAERSFKGYLQIGQK